MRVAAFIAAFACALVCARGTATAAPTVALPPLVGHVVDPGHQLSTGDYARLDGELEGLRARTGHAIVVLVLSSLGGEPIEDVAYRAFNTWGVGGTGKNDGVLLVVSTGEREVRIETGKGVGGALTDLQSNDIIRLQIGPLLAKGQLYAGLEAGVQAIAAALAKDPSLAPATRAPPTSSSDNSMVLLIVVGVMIVLGIGAAVSPAIRGVLWPVLRLLGGILRILAMFSGRGGGGSGKSRYGGGGGRSGGGGSSGSY
ncbi:MAG: TPM domain-containing protein [Deltaproteobacteria bacterium]|nr:TPM domain-containing protein [Deltaproteobacteria bacterium]